MAVAEVDYLNGGGGSGIDDLTDSCGMAIYTSSGTVSYDSTTKTYTAGNGANGSFGFDLSQYVGKYSEIIWILTSNATGYAYVGGGSSPSYGSTGTQTYRKLAIPQNTESYRYSAFTYEPSGADKLYFSTGGNTTVTIYKVLGIK